MILIFSSARASAPGACRTWATSESVEVEHVWNDVWEQERLRQAVEQLRSEIGATKAFRAFELYVILDHAPQEVAQQLGMHLDSVYRAKEQITVRLREALRELRD